MIKKYCEKEILSYDLKRYEGDIYKIKIKTKSSRFKVNKPFELVAQNLPAIGKINGLILDMGEDIPIWLQLAIPLYYDNAIWYAIYTKETGIAEVYYSYDSKTKVGTLFSIDSNGIWSPPAQKLIEVKENEEN